MPGFPKIKTFVKTFVTNFFLHRMLQQLIGSLKRELHYFLSSYSGPCKHKGWSRKVHISRQSKKENNNRGSENIKCYERCWGRAGEQTNIRMPQNRILCCYTQDAQKVPLISNNTVWLCIENLASEAPILKDQWQRRVFTPTVMSKYLILKLPCRRKGWMTTPIWCTILPEAHGTLFLHLYSKEWKQMKDNESKKFVKPESIHNKTGHGPS